MPDTVQKAEEPSLRDQLLADYEAHEDRVEDAATTELWALGDWLAKYVPNQGGGRPPKTSTREDVLKLDDLVARRGRSRSWLHALRAVAWATAADRLPLIAPRVYTEALRQNDWDLMAANASLVTKGHRLRDQAPRAMESVDAIKGNLAKRTPEERAEVAEELMREPTVRELLGGEPTPDMGAAWADKYVVRLEETADKLTALVRREGLVFSPDADVAWFLEALKRAEHQVAELRAAVQERIQDQRMEEVG
jgi:hypothetical protein